jgi:hypothetical protein
VFCVFIRGGRTFIALSILNNIWERKMSTDVIIEYVKKFSILCGMRNTDTND